MMTSLELHVIDTSLICCRCGYAYNKNNVYTRYKCLLIQSWHDNGLYTTKTNLMRVLLQKLQLIFFLSAIFALQATAQEIISLKQANKRIDLAQLGFIKLLPRVVIDKDNKSMINRFVTTELDSLQIVIKDDKSLSEPNQVQALNCVSYFLETIKQEVEKKFVDINQIKDIHSVFIPLWQNMRTGQSSDKIIGDLNIKTANIIVLIFKDFPQSSNIKDITVLKSMALTPDKIMNFLGSSPTYIFRDSLLYIYANTEPERFLNAAQGTKDPDLSKAIQQHASPLIKTLLSIAGEKKFKDYLPFAALLAQNKITLAEIDKARSNPVDYYKMIVDAEMDNQAMFVAGKTPMYRLPTRKFLKEYAIRYFTDVVNSLHEEPNEKARYFVLDDLRPQDLYFILIGGETELYTSSYLYTYKKLMASFGTGHNDSLFRLVNYDRYRKFLSMAGRYNTLSAFMNDMPAETRVTIIKRFINGLEAIEGSGLDETITVAETFPGMIKNDELANLTIQEIKNNYARNKNINNEHGMKLYSILTEMFAAVKNNELGNKSGLSPELAVYYNVTHQSLKDKDGTINQLVLFYGDDDGKASYSSFMGNFSDASQWSIEKNASWTTIKSKKLYPIAIYANLPLDNVGDLDLKAQELLKAYLKTNQVSCHILIHRGHSYHLANSIKSVTEATRLAILGSCGGYKEIFDVLENSLAAQVISTKQVGSKQVNEPLLKIINDKLLNKKDLEWSDIWATLDKQLKGNKLAYDYFQEYVPPYKNIALLLATLFYTGADARPDDAVTNLNF